MVSTQRLRSEAIVSYISLDHVICFVQGELQKLISGLEGGVYWLLCTFSLISLTTLLQVENQREQLLAHPLVTFLLNYKWKKFGRYIYYFKLSLYCIFLFFLTGYTVYSTENGTVCVNGTKSKPSSDTIDEDSAPYVLWIKVGRIVILLLASWQILSEVGIFWGRQFSCVAAGLCALGSELWALDRMIRVACRGEPQCPPQYNLLLYYSLPHHLGV